jgi:hypothetical protein
LVYQLELQFPADFAKALLEPEGLIQGERFPDKPGSLPDPDRCLSYSDRCSTNQQASFRFVELRLDQAQHSLWFAELWLDET